MNEMDLPDGDIVLYELTQMAQALQQAEELTLHRADYFASLYDGVRMSTVPFGDHITAERGSTADTASQALEIIDRKNAYDKVIKRLYARHALWRGFLSEFSEREADLLERYIERGEDIQDKQMDRVLCKAKKLMGEMDRENGQALDRKAKEHYTRLCERFPYMREKKELRKPDTQQYFMNGKYVYATPEDYEVYQQQEREREKQFKEFLFDRNTAQ